MQERDIEDVLELHPYLIREPFRTGYIIKRQKELGAGRADLILYEKNGKNVYIVELKKNRLNQDNIKQIKKYMIALRKEPGCSIKKIFGILIGLNPYKEMKLYKNVELGFLNESIPLKVKLCSHCRDAVDVRSDECNCGRRTFL